MTITILTRWADVRFRHRRVEGINQETRGPSGVGGISGFGGS